MQISFYNFFCEIPQTILALLGTHLQWLMFIFFNVKTRRCGMHWKECDSTSLNLKNKRFNHFSVAFALQRNSSILLEECVFQLFLVRAFWGLWTTSSLPDICSSSHFSSALKTFLNRPRSPLPRLKKRSHILFFCIGKSSF